LQADRPVTDVIATQPGFVPDALGNVYARGNHANIQYQIDGIPVPDSVGSLFAASIPTRLVQGLEIITGGMPAEFGDRLGAVVNLVTRAAGDWPEGAAQMRYGSFNTVGPGAVYSSKLSEHVGALVGGSVLSSQRALDPPSVASIMHDAGYDGRVFARVDYDLDPANHYELFATYAHNRFEIPIDPSVAPLDPANPNFVRPVDRYGNASPPFIPHDTDASETEDELFVAASYLHRFALRVSNCQRIRRQFVRGAAQRVRHAVAAAGGRAPPCRGEMKATGRAPARLTRGSASCARDDSPGSASPCRSTAAYRSPSSPGESRPRGTPPPSATRSSGSSRCLRWR
jgi:outer membrane receptor protein involved in Fe transport